MSYSISYLPPAIGGSGAGRMSSELVGVAGFERHVCGTGNIFAPGGPVRPSS
jgi:hypothetical protein